MKKVKAKIKGLDMTCHKGNIKVLKSYQIKSKAKMKIILEEALEKFEDIYESNRTMKSLIREWRAHNRLYNLHLFRKSTEDCDFEAKLKIMYFFLGF